MGLLTATWKGSQRVGLVTTILCAIAWLVCGVVAATAAVLALSEYPKVAYAVFVIIAIPVVGGGLVSFWLIADHIDFLRLGYRVRWLTGTEWLYEERVPEVGLRSILYVRVILRDGYPALSEIHLPGDTSWDADTPEWAQDRRAEIAGRIAKCHGGDRGDYVRFAHG